MSVYLSVGLNLDANLVWWLFHEVNKEWDFLPLLPAEKSKLFKNLQLLNCFDIAKIFPVEDHSISSPQFVSGSCCVTVLKLTATLNKAAVAHSHT